jgi:hypothetical protein
MDSWKLRKGEGSGTWPMVSMAAESSRKIKSMTYLLDYWRNGVGGAGARLEWVEE